jgi:hypothetical protein
VGLIDKAWMCRAKVSGELVQSVVSDKDTGRDAQHAVISIEVLNRGAAAGRVTFAKDFLKVAGQKLNNSIVHVSILWISRFEYGTRAAWRAYRAVANSPRSAMPGHSPQAESHILGQILPHVVQRRGVTPPEDHAVARGVDQPIEAGVMPGFLHRIAETARHPIDARSARSRPREHWGKRDRLGAICRMFRWSFG